MRPAILCARGGSKGVPGKNTRLIAGRPLIAWTIAAAKASGRVDLVAVSSDSEEILEAARAAGADMLVRRPAELATDTVSVLPAIEHCLGRIEEAQGGPVADFVYLQATSPTRTVADIAGAIDLFDQHRPASVITGADAKCSPYFSLVEEQRDGTVRRAKTLDPPPVRRQDAPRCFDMNGSIYVVDRARFARDVSVLFDDTRLFEMSEENSVDIDTELDFRIAALILEQRNRDGHAPSDA